MYMRLDEEGSCWEYCRGMFKPGRRKEQNDRRGIQSEFLAWLVDINE